MGASELLLPAARIVQVIVGGNLKFYRPGYYLTIRVIRFNRLDPQTTGFNRHGYDVTTEHQAHHRYQQPLQLRHALAPVRP